MAGFGIFGDPQQPGTGMLGNPLAGQGVLTGSSNPWLVLLGQALRGGLAGAAAGRGTRGFGAGLGIGGVAGAQSSYEAQANKRRNDLADQQIQTGRISNAATLDALNRRRAFLGQQPLSQENFAAGNWGGMPDQPAGGMPMSAGGMQQPTAGPPMTGGPDETGAAPAWKHNFDMGQRALQFGLPDDAASYFAAAKADPDYEAAKARGLIPVKVEEQLSLMPGKVQESGLTAGADAGARLPYQKSLAGYDSGLALSRGMTLAQYNNQLDLASAGPKAAAMASAQAASPAQLNTNIEKLRDDFRSDANVKSYQTIVPIIQSMHDAATREGGASDLNIVYGVAKIMDPNSVVREGEQVLVKDTGGLSQQIMGAIQWVNNGQRLTPEMRKALVTEADSRASSLKQANDIAANFYANQARTLGADPNRVIYDTTPSRANAPTNDPLGLR